MKKSLGITLGTVLAAALSSTVFADENEFLARSAIWVTGTWTEASNNGTSYGDMQQSPPINIANGVAAIDGVHRHVFVDQDMEFDYALGYSYHIPCSATRFFVSYDHYRDGDDSTNSPFMRNLGVTPNSSAYGHVSNHAQEFRIGLSHTTKFNNQFHFDLSGFFAWDEVKRDIDERITNSNQALFYRNTFESVKGWGPGVGGRARTIPFICYPNFGFFVGANTTLIWAENDYEASLRDNANGIETLIYGYDPESTESVVGKIDISFGLNYSRQLRDFSCSMIDIALGLRYMNMFNVFKNGNAYQNPVFPGSNANDFAANLGYPNDFGRVGPFLTFAIGGAKA